MFDAKCRILAQMASDVGDYKAMIETALMIP
jgi:hypothetical protein